MTKHTKGPWDLSNPKTRIIGIKPAPETPDEGGSRLAQVIFSYMPDNRDYPACQVELVANARLIKAAPDMLEALEIALEQGDFQPRVKEIIVNTINKAKGVI